MKSYRINKDITNRLHVLTNGKAEPLADRDLALQLIDPKGNKKFVLFTFSDNVLEFVYYGMKQKYLGVYQFTLWENYGKVGMTAVDCVDAFCLVANTDLEGGEDPEGLDTEVNDLTIDLSTGVRGADGRGIESIVQTTTSTEDGGINIVTQTLTDGTTATFEIRNGSKGSQGERGERGEQGLQGERGERGLQGERGERGEQGEQGERGLQGERGEKGEKGDAGADWIPTQAELDSIAQAAAELVEIPEDLADLNEDSTHRLVTDQEKTAWNAKASTNSPTFTGTPEAPTAEAGTSTTQIATTAFVQSAFSAAMRPMTNEEIDAIII